MFDLGGISGTVQSATLTLDVADPDGYISTAPSLIYALYDITTPIPVIVAGNAGVGAYDDFGSGIRFGTHIATNAQEGTAIQIALNAAALASIQAGLGFDWAIGGTIADSSAVPEPATVTLAAAALTALFIARRRS